MKKKNIKLGTKLLIMFIILSVIPMVILGGIQFIKTNKSMRNQFEQNSKEYLSLAENTVDTFFNEFIDQVEILSQNKNIIDIHKSLEVETYAQNVINSVKESNKFIKDVYFSTADGKLYSSLSGILGESYDGSNRDWYKKAVEGQNKINISDAYLDVVDNNNVITLSKAVYNGNDLVGVLGIDINIDKLSNKLSNIKIGESGYIYILDRNGITVSHNKSEFLGKDTFSKLPFWKEVSTNNDGIVRYNFEGKNKIAIFDTDKLTGWKLISTITNDEINKESNNVLKTSLILFVIILVAVILLAIIFNKHLTKNIDKIKEGLKRAAEGNFSEKVIVNSRDELEELADDYNRFCDSIGALIGETVNTTEFVVETSKSLAEMTSMNGDAMNQIAQAIEEIAGGSTDQARNSQDSVGEMNGLADMINKVISETEVMKELALKSDNLTGKGIGMIKILEEGSNDSRNASRKVNDVVNEVNKSNRKISNITKVITDITEQTNLLALNAAIEAARAGEAGKGFAVVADEIRKLSEQSRISTEEIGSIIEEMQIKYDMVMEALNNADESFEIRNKSVDETKNVFNEILLGVKDLSLEVEKVVEWINKISSGKDAAVDKINSVSVVAQEIAASTEEVSATVEEVNSNTESLTNHSAELSDIAEKLQSQIEKFKY
ncbi:methyl-accepting chemotaxis sensory transducer [Clostridium fallax]|uniref:Methyl-accepting chemotaxis protein n=2 Tax=Clostridium fallax TaxID=1533 RepID=A0A1M4UPB0_9CLOT|nr:methyl-accepting chemotaxis protein [Clostridium fallax]SHE58497.1 methyl-accepting chemotaxis protein [Clostridium fallax]SQB07669.1 methyl-accepting chemotaxis sensory transducer [Clostridium fallax]